MKKIALLLSLVLGLAVAQVSTDPVAYGELVGEWQLDEATGTVVYDSSGYHNDGTIYGATWTTCNRGSALSFDGVNDYVGCGINGSLGNMPALTIKAWINRASPALGGQDHIVTNWIMGYHFYLNGASKFGFDIWTDAGQSPTVESTTTISDNTWYYLVGTYDGSTMKVYVNGVLENSVSHTGDIRDVTGYNTYIGGKYDQWPTMMFNGMIDEVKIYNRALSYKEVTDSYKGLETRLATTFVVAASNAHDTTRATADYVCDGTDDQVQIQAALDSLPACGGMVQLTEGTFNIRATLQLTSGKALRGTGIQATTLLLGADVTLLQIGTNASWVRHITLSNLLLLGNSRSYSNTSHGVYITGPGTENNFTNQIVLRDIRMERFVGSALKIEYTQDSVFDNVSITDCGSAGVAAVDLIGNSAVEVGCNIFYSLRMDAPYDVGVKLNNYAHMNRFIAPKMDMFMQQTYGFVIAGEENLIDGLIAYTGYDNVTMIRFEELGGLHCQRNVVSNSFMWGNSVKTATIGINNNATGYGQNFVNNHIVSYYRGIRDVGTDTIITGNKLINCDIPIDNLGVATLIRDNKGYFTAPQMGEVTGISTASTGIKSGAVTFPTAYPTGTTPSITLTLKDPSSTTLRFDDCYVTSVSNTGFTRNVVVRTSVTSSTVKLQWVAQIP